MRKLLLRRPSPALVIACVALGAALGGTGYATVLQVPRNSVGPAQLKASAVTTGKLAPNAVTSARCDRSLLRADFATGQLPAGPPGPNWARGQAGPRGLRVERGRARRDHVGEQLRPLEDRVHRVPGRQETPGRGRTPQPGPGPGRASAVVSRQRQHLPCDRTRGRRDPGQLVADRVRGLRNRQLSGPVLAGRAVLSCEADSREQRASHSTREVDAVRLPVGG